ncbi:hypothetical protein [Curtobacterium flaccumfaciens]
MLSTWALPARFETDANPDDPGDLMDQYDKIARLEGNGAVLDQLAEEHFE